MLINRRKNFDLRGHVQTKNNEIYFLSLLPPPPPPMPGKVLLELEKSGRYTIQLKAKDGS